MATEPTDLDKLRAEYVRQIIEAARQTDDGLAFGMVDSLVMEWGAKAFHAGKLELLRTMERFV
jgi:hypothetical protein